MIHEVEVEEEEEDLVGGLLVEDLEEGLVGDLLGEDLDGDLVMDLVAAFNNVSTFCAAAACFKNAVRFAVHLLEGLHAEQKFLASDMHLAIVVYVK
ncbi:hypothetical protein SUGI_0694340 [Cryptomeria japonica]|nr:hypothetical protein SUGI_0694340 [Cryptomeria japonica]